jgi:hypothetical protein
VDEVPLADGHAHAALHLRHLRLPGRQLSAHLRVRRRAGGRMPAGVSVGGPGGRAAADSGARGRACRWRWDASGASRRA